MMNKLLVCFLVLCCAGCATSNLGNVGFNEAPQGVPDEETAIIYFMRQKVNPSMRSPSIRINDQKVGTLSNNSFFWTRVTPGNVLISTEWSWDTGAGSETMQINIEPNKTYYLILKQLKQKITWPVIYSSFSSKFFEIDEDIALQYLNRFKYCD